jgi:hypothetical protein
MEDLSFEDYLIQKKIDKTLFLKSKPLVYEEWKLLFQQIHPDSFTAQKKFLINSIRREFLLP